MSHRSPFVPYKEQEERDNEKGRVFTIRLNEQEIGWLNEIKEDLNIATDGKALKMMAFIGKNVLQSLLGRKFVRYLFKKDRQKLTDFKDF